MRMAPALALAAAGGLILWHAHASRRRSAAAATIAISEGNAEAAPSLLDALLGRLSEEAKAYLDKADALEKMISARGAAHLEAWKAAVRRGDSHYAVREAGADHCYETSSGKDAALVSCVRAGTPSILEGWR